MSGIFGDLDVSAFWDEHEFYARQYTDDPPTPDEVFDEA